MKIELLSIFDTQAKAFNHPFAVPTLAIGERAFRIQVNREGTDFNLSPADYSLWHVGSFSDATGQLEVKESPVLVVQAVTLKEGEAQ